MLIPQQFIEDLQRDADIVTVIGRHVSLTQKGSSNSHLGLCPFHNEKTASFTVNPVKGFYYCFGCQAAGTALGFLMKHVHGGNFITAVEDLAQQMGRKVPREQSAIDKMPVNLLEEMAKLYQAKLFDNSKVRDYLKNRGIDKKTALRFRIGYAPADGGFKEAFGDVKSKYKDLTKVGLAKQNDDKTYWTYFRNRLMFPITSPTGEIRGFGGRILGDGEPKYLNSPESAVFNKRRIVYGLNESAKGISKDKKVIVVEGYMDVVALARHGIANAVATMGTAATLEQIRTIMSRTSHLVFCFDGDEAGYRAARKVLINVMPALSDGKSVKFVHLLKDQDPDTIVTNQGAEAFIKLVDNAEPLESMLFEGNKDAQDATSKSDLWRHSASLLEQIDKKRAPFMYAELYKELANISGISVESLKEASQSVANVAKARQVTQDAALKVSKGPSSSRKMKKHDVFYLLACLYDNPSYVEELIGLPVDCSEVSDIKFYRAVVEELDIAIKNKDTSRNIKTILTAKGALGLIDQLEKHVEHWQKGSDNLDKTFEKLMIKVNKKFAKVQRMQQSADAIKNV